MAMPSSGEQSREGASTGQPAPHCLPEGKATLDLSAGPAPGAGTSLGKWDAGDGSGSLGDQAKCLGQDGEVGARADRNLCAHEMRAEPLLTHKAPSNKALVALLEPRRTPCLASPGCAGTVGGSCHIPLPELAPRCPQQQWLHLLSCPPRPSIPGQAGWPRWSQPCPAQRKARLLKWANLPAEAAQT